MFAAVPVKGIYLHTMSARQGHRVAYLALFTLVACCVALTLAPRKATAHLDEQIWVSLEDTGEVVQVDHLGKVVTRVAVGKRPRGIKMAHGKLYVALSGSPRAAPGADESKLPPADRAADGIGVVDFHSGKLEKVLHSGQDPESFDVSDDGKTIYVSNEETAKMTVLDLVSGKITREVDVGHEPEGVTLGPHGKVVYVTSEQDNVVVAVDTKTLKVLAQIPTGPRPRSIAFSKDGKTGFVANENGAQVTVIDAVKNVPLGTIKIEARAKTPLGPRPMGTAVSRDGKTLAVSCGRGESVAIVDVATRKVVRLIDGVGARPWGIQFAHGGTMFYTANGPSGDVSFVDAATGEIKTRAKVGGQPWGLTAAIP
jgi:YVTN family beta-propeller protein